jgi:hypothetical protein
MDIKIVYPHVSRKKRTAPVLRTATKWAFLFTAYACVISNLYAGGKAWSVVVVWSLWFLWSFLFAPDMVEYNRISQASKLLAYSCILLILINVLLAPGWAAFVVPVICFGGLILIAVLFFTDYEKQRQNMMPMVWLLIGSIVMIIMALAGWPEMSWPMVAMGATALGILVLCFGVMGRTLLLEIRKRFHAK